MDLKKLKMGVYLLTPLNLYNPRQTFMMMSYTQRLIFSYVDKCDMYHQRFKGDVEGALLLAPNLFGQYHTVADVGPDFLADHSEMIYFTDDEIEGLMKNSQLDI